jgi:hypothetical protein
MVGILWTSRKIIHAPGYIKGRKEHLITEEDLQDRIRKADLVERVVKEKDADIATTLFIEEMERILEGIAPTRIIQLRKNYAKWIGDEEKELVLERKEAYDRARSVNSEEEWRLYRSINKRVTKCLREVKKKWLCDKMGDTSSVKDVWNTAKSFWNSDSQGPPKALKVNGRITSKPIEMANELNRQYIKKVVDFRSETAAKQRRDPMEMLREMTGRVEDEFEMKHITFNQTRNLIASFKNSNSKGVDTISINHIKKGGIQLIIILKHLINISISQNKVADVLKLTRISPLRKKGKDETLPLSYRPINNVSSVSKVLDRHIFSQLSLFLEDRGIIHNNHHGGRPQHSTTTAMLDIYNKMAEIVDQGDAVALLAIDLSAAYDLCDHLIMINKLEHYGVRGSNLAWFKSYLDNRMQCVQIGAATTSLTKLPPCSVIQGSVGSGLLYTIYTNDLSCVVPYNISKEEENGQGELISKGDCTINFVDDSSTLIRAKYPHQLTPKLEKYYGWLKEYFLANFMIINADKTAAVVSSKKERNYVLNTMQFKADNFIIKPSQVIKLLGYFLSSNLSHDCHVLNDKEALVKKLYKRINVLKRLSPYTNFTTRKVIGNAIFNGTLTYLMPLWGSAEMTTVAKLQQIQLSAARIIIGRSCYMYSTERILKNVKWMSVAQMIVEKTSVMMHTIVKYSIPRSISNQFKLVKRDVRTRADQQVVRIDGFISNTEFIRRQFMYRALKYYNELPIEIKSLEKRHYKKTIKTHIKTTIPVKGQQFLL